MSSDTGHLFPTTRLTLIESLRDTASPAWETFFQIYGPIVFRMACRAGLPHADAEEVVATVMSNFAQVVRGGFRVDHESGRFRSYLRTITNREIAAQWRRRSRKADDLTTAQSIADASPAPDERWQEMEQQERWRLCLERLERSGVIRPRDLDAFLSYAVAGEPADQVARSFGVKRNRLYGIKHEILQALRRIRRQLDEELGEV